MEDATKIVGSPNLGEVLRPTCKGDARACRTRESKEGRKNGTEILGTNVVNKKRHLATHSRVRKSSLWLNELLGARRGGGEFVKEGGIEGGRKGTVEEEPMAWQSIPRRDVNPNSLSVLSRTGGGEESGKGERRHQTHLRCPKKPNEKRRHQKENDFAP